MSENKVLRTNKIKKWLAMQEERLYCQIKKNQLLLERMRMDAIVAENETYLKQLFLRK